MQDVPAPTVQPLFPPIFPAPAAAAPQRVLQPDLLAQASPDGLGDTAPDPSPAAGVSAEPDAALAMQAAEATEAARATAAAGAEEAPASEAQRIHARLVQPPGEPEPGMPAPALLPLAIPLPALPSYVAMPGDPGAPSVPPVPEAQESPREVPQATAAPSSPDEAPPGTLPADGAPAAEAVALLEALYPLLLRRPVDGHGLRQYGAILREHGMAAGVLPVLQSLLTSEEHRAAAPPGLLDATLARDVAPVFGPVSHVASLGVSCYPAWLMQQCGVKTWSGPFDWLFSSADMVVRCLEDDFAAFLDPAQLRSLGDGRSTHAAYGPAITAGPVFNHRDVTLPEHRAYTERCVHRFRAMLADDGLKCFVMVLPGHPSRPDRQLAAEFGRVAAALAGRTAGFRLLMVSHDQAEGGLASSLREVERRAEGSLFRFRSASAMQAGLSFRQEWDNLALKRLLWSNTFALRGAP